MRRAFAPLLALLALSSCNANRAGPEITIPPPPTSVRVTPAASENPNCAADIASFRKLQDEDLAQTRVGQGVYDEIKGEIAEADKACAEGDNLRALGLLRGIKARHGYAGS
jgi:hypothetical protein